MLSEKNDKNAHLDLIEFHYLRCMQTLSALQENIHIASAEIF